MPKFAWRAKRQSPTANAALRVSLAAPSSSCTAVSPDMGMKAGWGWLQPAQIPGDNSWGSYGAGHALAALGASFLRHLRAEQVLRQHRFCSSCHRTQRARLLPSQVKAPFPWRLLGSLKKSSWSQPFPSVKGMKNKHKRNVLRLSKHTWSPPAARLSPYTVAVHWQTPGNVSENCFLGKENSFSIPAHTHSHHCALQVGTSREQPVLYYPPSLPTASPPEKATENDDLRECEVIKGSRAKGSKPQQPAGRDIPPAAAIPRHIDVHSGSYPHPAPPCCAPQQSPGTPRFQCNLPGQCTGLLFVFSCTTPRKK